MKAIQVNSFGAPKVLKVQEVNVPVISNSEVLVKVMSAGVNPVDTYLRDGHFAILPELPYTPGKDGAGIIDRVGENVTKFKKGQRVFVCCRSQSKHGTYAEFCVADEKDTFSLDERLSFEQGAALGIPYFTAYRALFTVGKAVSKEVVLIHGASGAVGLAAVQLARHHKMLVIGTAGTEDGMKLVKENGADYVLCHRDNNYMKNLKEITEGKGVDIVIEMLASTNLVKDLEVLSPGGRVMVVGCRGSISLDPRVMMLPETKIIGVALFNSSKEEWEETSNAILAGIKEGYLSPVVDKCYTLEQAPDSHRDIIKSKGAKGKLVINTASA